LFLKLPEPKKRLSSEARESQLLRLADKAQAQRLQPIGYPLAEFKLASD
jgi:hypothetical protein